MRGTLLVALLAILQASAATADIVVNFVGEPILTPPPRIHGPTVATRRDSASTLTVPGRRRLTGSVFGSRRPIRPIRVCWPWTTRSRSMTTAAGSAYTAIAQAVVAAGSIADANGYAWTAIPTITLNDAGQSGDYYILTATQGTDAWGPTTGTNSWSSVNSYFGTPTGRGWYNASRLTCDGRQWRGFVNLGKRRLRRPEYRAGGARTIDAGIGRYGRRVIALRF